MFSIYNLQFASFKGGETCKQYEKMDSVVSHNYFGGAVLLLIAFFEC